MAKTLKNNEISVPAGTGVGGFLASIRRVLELPGLQEIHVNRRGVVSYSRYAQDDEKFEGEDFFKPSLDGLLPSHLIRHIPLTELDVEDKTASTSLGFMLFHVAIAGLIPNFFAISPNSTIWDWHKTSTGMDVGLFREVLYGVPVLIDQDIPNESIVLFAGEVATKVLVESTRAYKITAPPVTRKQ